MQGDAFIDYCSYKSFIYLFSYYLASGVYFVNEKCPVALGGSTTRREKNHKVVSNSRHSSGHTTPISDTFVHGKFQAEGIWEMTCAERTL